MGKQWLTLFLGASKSLQMVTAAIKLKDAYSLEGKLPSDDTSYPALEQSQCFGLQVTGPPL